MARNTRPAPDKEIRALQKSFNVARSGRLYLNVPGADLELVASDTNKVEVDVYVKSQSTNEALALTDRIKLRIRAVDKQTVRVESKSFYQNELVGWNTDDAIQIRLQVRLPKAFNVDIEAASSHTSLTSIQGEVSLQLFSGSLEATHMKGRLNIQAKACDLDLREFNGTELSLSAAACDLQIHQIKANDVSVEASGSSSTLSDISANSRFAFFSGDADLKAIAGSLDVEALASNIALRLNEFDDARFKVCGGALDIKLKQGIRARLQLEGPDVHLDKRFEFTGDQEEDRIEGQINEGNNLLQAYAAAGSIHCKPV